MLLYGVASYQYLSAYPGPAVLQRTFGKPRVSKLQSDKFKIERMACFLWLCILDTGLIPSTKKGYSAKHE